MSALQTMFQTVAHFRPFILTVFLVVLVLWGAHRTLVGRHLEKGNERLFPRQLFLLALSLAGLLAVVLALPVSEGLRNQIIALIGLVVSGILAFSSSTVFSNLMAGIMLRITKPFDTGDFIRIGDHFGRVVDRGLLDTEIQSENRELVAFTNTYLISHPVTVTRSSGAIISIDLSLGYDIHHATVESLLLEAATACGLEDPFVQIIGLGDFSVSYKVSGLLLEVKGLLTARSNLRRAVLDTLHENGIEIVSPAFMNQRRLGEEHKMIPSMTIRKTRAIETDAEDVVFDKAEQAEQIKKDQEALQARLTELIEKVEKAAGEAKRRMKEEIQTLEEQLQMLKEKNLK